jgi:hypothetical protein
VEKECEMGWGVRDVPRLYLNSMTPSNRDPLLYVHNLSWKFWTNLTCRQQRPLLLGSLFEPFGPATIDVILLVMYPSSETLSTKQSAGVRIPLSPSGKKQTAKVSQHTPFAAGVSDRVVLQ